MIVQKSKSKLVSILIQTLIWVVLGIVLLFNQPIGWGIEVPHEFWVKQNYTFGLLVAAYYLNAYYLVPKFLLKNHMGFYFLSAILVVAVIMITTSWLDRYLELPRLFREAFMKMGPPKGGERKHHGYDILTLAISALVIGISTSITTTQIWQKDKQRHQEMEQEKISSELSFLKAQINPHFFFNTLNNIYALTVVNVETSRTAIHQLSRMMRYVLYDTQNSTALLSQEIAFIKDYISLMQLRLTERVTVNFITPNPLKDFAIAPMLFLTFVENAFKHGVSDTQPSTIEVIIEQNDNKVNLMVKNGIFKTQGTNIEENQGIGLNNTIRRLDLLYPGQYTLKVAKSIDDNTYLVNLTINL
ncbi:MULTISPECIES: histidine kinase [unclassified Mucilaginibacter]|uniref:sensor histidine kinase n=1 Tax=unclassified Mucilaginibacter TaxID=2617802 RepID=UPI002AC9E9FC|nr:MULTISPECIES: histidine kinase [unclassified Mucilaginibacter]MEB0249597.1 histidine kinase [Mucilaginibacter sp. 5B2]MEB0262460.1 histidine kinase [Mucilaginibacter sp. 10I4]MEB0279285.1 histidine kinase [Mucilaginibacter sp. 10B2]MEB0302577.1 histidine kinase [Mucilaginibacter sp. 5C4]WPX23203.1 histidine kinase [Mucilaginibacter sp. 5C4]